MKDIDFLYDDTHLEKQELEKIAKEATKEPVKKDFNAVILRKFTLALINAVAGEKQREFKKPEAKPVAKEIKPQVQEKIPAPELKVTKVEEKIIPVAPISAPKPEFPEFDIIKTAEGKVMAKSMLKDHDYFLQEPILNDKDKELLKKLTGKLEGKILKKPDLVNDKAFILKFVQKFSKRLKIPFSMDYFESIRYYLVRNIIGYSLIDPLIRDPHVKEIHFIGLHKPLQIIFNEEKNIETNIIFERMEDVNLIIKKFFDKAKQKLTKDGNYIDTDIIGFQVKAYYDFSLKESKFDIKK